MIDSWRHRAVTSVRCQPMRTLAGSRLHNVAMVTSHLTLVALTTWATWGRDCRISPTRRTPANSTTNCRDFSHRTFLILFRIWICSTFSICSVCSCFVYRKISNRSRVLNTNLRVSEDSREINTAPRPTNWSCHVAYTTPHGWRPNIRSCCSSCMEQSATRRPLCDFSEHFQETSQEAFLPLFIQLPTFCF